MDSVQFRQYEHMSPFEIKDELIRLAKAGTEKSAATMLNAGRGNPNWIATKPRDAFFTLGHFALTESRQVKDHPAGLGGMPAREGIGARLQAWIAMNGNLPGAAYLGEMVDLAISQFGFDRDAFVHELVGFDHRGQLPGT